MSNFSQWKYVLVAYALKGTVNTSDITNYLCHIIEMPTNGSTPERSINMYVAQNTHDNLYGRNHKGSWYVRVDNGEYRLDCPQDLESRISYVKYAKYDANKSLVFSEHDFYNIIAEFLDKDKSLNKDKILEYCRKERSVDINVDAIRKILPEAIEKHIKNEWDLLKLDITEFQKILVSYKAVFVSKQWPEEKYKWIAVKHFQDNWDIDAPDFAAMLKNALAKTGNLLVSVNNFPERMITEFAEVAPEQVRAMFKELFDETLDIWQRVKSFKEKSQPLLDIHGKNAKNHYQGENTIFTYLWLRYPEKYYIYKISELKTVAETLHSNLVFQNGKYEDNIRNFLKLYNAIRLELLKDDELKTLLKSQLTDDCYADDALCTLTIDFGFYISRRYRQGSNNENDNASWFPTDYAPGFSVEDWVKLLNDPEIFTTSNLEIMARILDFGGAATCKQLSNKYGEHENFYNSGSSKLAERIHKKTNCPVMAENTENSRWWPILYLGRYNEDKNVSGVYIWKLRPELAEALKQVDLSGVKLYADMQTAEEPAMESYSQENFLSEVFMTSDKYNSLVRMLKAKKNIILQGAPGVGKTFAARRLAYSIMGVKDDSRIEFVQFHQNYSYEDFVMGYKPNENGFELKNGIFYSFCQKAASAPDKDYFFIIDEINRGNMSKIFGELLMLIEKDCRGTPLTLAYNGLPFHVPKNLHIIGMMNTADRSLAMIDYALRRRFSFFDMEPGFDSDGFIAYQQDLNSEKLDRLVAELKSLNNAIIEDKSLGKGFCIGHSYLCGEEICTDEWLRGVVEYDILPMLAEYWFDELDKYEEWKKRLTDAVK